MSDLEARQGFLFRGTVAELEPSADKHDLEKERLAVLYADKHPEEPLAMVKFTTGHFSNIEAEAEAFYSLTKNGDLSGIRDPELRDAIQEYRDQTAQEISWQTKTWRLLEANLTEIQKADDIFNLQGPRTSTFILTQDKRDVKDLAGRVKSR